MTTMQHFLVNHPQTGMIPPHIMRSAKKKPVLASAAAAAAATVVPRVQPAVVADPRAETKKPRVQPHVPPVPEPSVPPTTATTASARGSIKPKGGRLFNRQQCVAALERLLDELVPEEEEEVTEPPVLRRKAPPAPPLIVPKPPVLAAAKGGKAPAKKPAAKKDKPTEPTKPLKSEEEEEDELDDEFAGDIDWDGDGSSRHRRDDDCFDPCDDTCDKCHKPKRRVTSLGSAEFYVTGTTTPTLMSTAPSIPGGESETSKVAVSGSAKPATSTADRKSSTAVTKPGLEMKLGDCPTAITGSGVLSPSIAPIPPNLVVPVSTTSVRVNKSGRYLIYLNAQVVTTFTPPTDAAVFPFTVTAPTTIPVLGTYTIGVRFSGTTCPNSAVVSLTPPTPPQIIFAASTSTFTVWTNPSRCFLVDLVAGTLVGVVVDFTNITIPATGTVAGATSIIHPRTVLGFLRIRRSSFSNPFSPFGPF